MSAQTQKKVTLPVALTIDEDEYYAVGTSEEESRDAYGENYEGYNRQTYLFNVTVTVPMTVARDGAIDLGEPVSPTITVSGAKQPAEADA